MNLIYLPPGPNGEKVGLDDFFKAGNTVEQLLKYATSELRPVPSDNQERRSPYIKKNGGLFLLKTVKDDVVTIPLTNFTARIIRDIIKNDGVETQREYEVQACLGGRNVKLSVPAATFGSLQWVSQHLGARAIVYPGLSVREHTKVAIQELSGGMPESRVYIHTGWLRRDDGCWVYLHGDGAIGLGNAKDVSVRLENGLEHFVLPSPPTGEALVAAVRASLHLLQLVSSERGPSELGFALLAAAFRAILGNTDFSLFFVGPSGVFKSEVAALLQQFFGAGLNARNLPGAWSSTDNSLEGSAFLLKDTVFVIDDFAPCGSQLDIQRLHAKADRIMRGQGNNAGRSRMNADGTLRPAKKSRSLIVATGEDVPRGHSLRARTCILEIAPDDITPDRLARCQQDANAGSYAQTTAAFCQWLAPHYEDVRSSMREKINAFRAKATGRHTRTPEITANLALGLDIFLDFALAVGAVDMDEAEQLWNKGWVAFRNLAARQIVHQASSDPVQRYLELLAAALASGSAHVADMQGEAPFQAMAWGWRGEMVGTDEDEHFEGHPQGMKVGWLDGEDLYLLPAATYKVVKQMGGNEGDGIVLGVSTMNKRLHERSYLQSIEAKRGALTVRRTVEGKRIDVLHLHASIILGTESDQPDQADGQAPAVNGKTPPVDTAAEKRSRLMDNISPSTRDATPNQSQADPQLFGEDGFPPDHSGRIGRVYQGDEPYANR